MNKDKVKRILKRVYHEVIGWNLHLVWNQLTFTKIVNKPFKKEK